MGGNDEIIIRNGTFWNWVTYKVRFGATEVDGAYTGGLSVYGGVLLVAAMLGAWVFGLAF